MLIGDLGKRLETCPMELSRRPTVWETMAVDDPDVDRRSGDTEGGDDDHPYGPDWPPLRDRVFRRDGHTCRRCGVDDRTLQAHHIVPRGAGGPDQPSNLITLCRPCHGVMHPRNRRFDDVRDEASLFPLAYAPDPVARMRDPEDHVCDRCGTECPDPDDLLAWRRDTANGTDRDAESTSSVKSTSTVEQRSTLESTSPVICCRPCAGLLLEAHPACSFDDLEGVVRPALHELGRQAPRASVRPSLFADEAVAIRREPRTTRERLIDDTPARFVANSRVSRFVAIAIAVYLFVFVMVVW